jgi:hypothetical protein
MGYGLEVILKFNLKTDDGTYSILLLTYFSVSVAGLSQDVESLRYHRLAMRGQSPTKQAALANCK